MLANDYDFTVTLSRLDGTTIGAAPAEVDWEPPYQCALFEAQRQGRLDPGAAIPAGRVEPVWDPEKGAPFVTGVRLCLGRNGDGGPAELFGCTYFRAAAQRASSQFVEQGALNVGEVFRYAVSAIERPCAPAPAAGGEAARFTFEARGSVAALPESNLRARVEHAVYVGPFSPGEMPVLLPAAALDACLCLARRGGELETGGMLAGRLYRDSSIGDVHLEITRQIPAEPRHVEASGSSLTFMPEAWQAARAAIARAGAGETMVGWWHSHGTGVLREQAKTAGGGASLSSVFLSQHDVTVMRMFPAHSSVALVIGALSTGGLTWGLYGWRKAELASRGFYLLGRLCARTERGRAREQAVGVPARA